MTLCSGAIWTGSQGRSIRHRRSKRCWRVRNARSTGRVFVDGRRGRCGQPILGRRICSSCHAVFHVQTNPPGVDGVCDFCGGQLESRSDDNEEAIRTRLATYRANTGARHGFYRGRRVLREVDGGQSVDQVFERLQEALKHRGFHLLAWWLRARRRRLHKVGRIKD